MASAPSLLDEEEIPTGVKHLLEHVKPEQRPIAEQLYREHRWAIRLMTKLDRTLDTIRLLLVAAPVAVGVIEALRYVLAHWKP